MKIVRPTLDMVQLVDRTHPLMRDLVGWWPCWENGGSKLFDVANQHRHTGSFVGGVTWGGGEQGSCLRLNGSTGYVSLGSTFDTQPELITISAWVRTSTTGSIDQICTRDDSIVPRHRVWQFRKNASEKVELIVFRDSDGGNGSAAGATSISDGKWHHVAATWDGTTIRIYVDGKLDGSGSYSGILEQGETNECRIGAGEFPDPGYWNGDICDVRIFSRPLPARGIAGLYLDPWSPIRCPRSVGFVSSGATTTVPEIMACLSHSPPSILDHEEVKTIPY